MYLNLLDEWFSDEVSQYWFNSTPEFDQHLRETYQSLWEQGVRGEIDSWREHAKGCLALVILFDQLPLNMFRGSANSFSSEAQSLDVARHAIDQEFDQDMPAQQKSFLYMPFMHSEDLQDQALSLQLFAQPGLENNLRFARHHYGIVEKYGRFPHRNKLLGRQNTAAEIEYLNSKEAFKG